MQSDHISREKGLWRGFPERLTPFFGGLFRIGSAFGIGVLTSCNPEYLSLWFTVALMSIILCAFFAWMPHIDNFWTRVLRCRPLSFRSADLVLLIIVQVSLMRLTTYVINLNITIWNARLGRIGASLIVGVGVLILVQMFRHTFYLFLAIRNR